MSSNAGPWWLPGAFIASVDVLAFVAGLATGGPDAIGGLVFGSGALGAAAVILRRRAPKGPVD